jgi:hypothetical protein
MALVVLLEHGRADDADDGVVVEEDTDDMRAPLDLLSRAIGSNRATQQRPVIQTQVFLSLIYSFGIDLITE